MKKLIRMDASQSDSNGLKKPPIVFAPKTNREMTNASALYAQNMLLEAMAGGVTDPKQLQKLAGLKKVSDVYLALDKLALRKEYHAALEKNGLSLDYILNKLKMVVDCHNPETSLKGVALIIKSLGLEKYDDTDTSESKPWEDIILEQTERGETIDAEIIEQEDYEVKQPVMEPEIEDRRKALKEEYKEMYEE